ncbi:MAG: DUF2249 domain-containing protein [Nitrospirae bacterium]|nr:DUF2249 domain-containing protein [Nitrospirota bacterium]
MDFLNKNVVELDVRAEVNSGSDPFKTIMTAVNSIKEGDVLHLINGFEPVPLYTVMKMKGYDHTTENKAGVWHIYFYQESTSGSEAASVQSESACTLGGNTVEIDVRGLEPPEPMVMILETLPKIGAGDLLLVHHHREPLMLYDKLEHLGYEASAEKVTEGYYKVRITKKA